MFVRVNAIFNTWGVILHEGRIDGLSKYESNEDSRSKSHIFTFEHKNMHESFTCHEKQ